MADPLGGKPPGDLRAFGDVPATRRNIYEDVHSAVSNLAPMTNDQHTLTLSNVRYIDPEERTKREHKQAILLGETTGRRLKGTWELRDNLTGKVVDKRDQVVARVPHMSDLGTFVRGGNDWTLNAQQRLRPGVYTRVKNNGEIESHANIMAGKGVSHRYMLDPAKGVFKLVIGQAEMPLMPLLRQMGATDGELRDAWGPEIHVANAKVDDPSVLRKLKERMLRKSELAATPEEGSQALVKAFERMELDPWVTQRTLGHPHAVMNKDAILATTRKLLAVSRKEAQADDRDSPQYQRVLGPEDLFSERIARDSGRMQQMAFRKASFTGSLAKMSSGVLTPQLEQALFSSGLGNVVEEINPAEVYDKQSRITRMGEGGIASLEAIPEESRNVLPGHYGLFDPIRTPESFRAGVDMHMSSGTHKGRDGQIYARWHNPKTGKTEWKSPQDLADATLAFPDWQKWPTKRVPVLRGGQNTYARKEEVQHVLPHMEHAFSALANLIPMKSAVKGQRLAMGSRMLTQALPLVNPESPMVRGAVPGSGGQHSYEAEHGQRVGAVHASQGGRVLSAKDGALQVRYDDGTTGDVELYQHHPFNRKTFLHQTPMVEPGERFGSGQLLAKSNYTDDKGVMALGLNARAAYLPWKGLNFEDALVISEGMAKRLSSEHMYQHDLEVSDQHKLGKATYTSIYPHKFTREVLDRLDDKGVIQPGQTVNFGEPLILAAKEKELAHNRILRRGQAGFGDDSVLWKHHDPGVVTDVAWGKTGPTVIVKSVSQMNIGDKISGRYGDKSVISSIIPDDQMPHDAEGKPFEILLNPAGIPSRTNPAQMLEGWLGKIAAKTGKPINVEDFGTHDDLTEWVHDQLKQHNLSSTEDVVDPTTGRKIPGVATGNRFFMKLHHVAESKSQGRGSGGYSAEDTPSKGGETGCFVGETLVALAQPGGGCVPGRIDEIVTLCYGGPVASRDLVAGTNGQVSITDWFSYRAAPESLVEVVLANGNRFVATRNHEVYLADGSHCRVADLDVGVDLME